MLSTITTCSKCGNDNVRQVVSPDGQYKIVLYRRSCGGVAPFLTNASILPTIANLQDEGGRVFVAEGDLAIDARWTEPRVVVLTVRGGGRVLKKVPLYDSNMIMFEFVDPER